MSNGRPRTRKIDQAEPSTYLSIADKASQCLHDATRLDLAVLALAHTHDIADSSDAGWID